jgi:diguanylate cyclase (GGDEF)-like protein/PAS domain S-box-containing protein
LLLDLLPDMNGGSSKGTGQRRDQYYHPNDGTWIRAGRNRRVPAVQGYLPKPVDPEKLKPAIQRILDQAHMQEEKERLTAELEEQVAWLTTLSRIGQSVTSTLQIDEVLQRIVAAGVFLTHSEEGFRCRMDRGQLYLRATKNIDEQRTRSVRLPIDDSLIGQVIKSKLPARLSGNNNQSSYKMSTGFLVTSLLHVPIISKGEVVGVLSVDNRISSKDFSEKDEVMLTSLGAYAAIAIENAGLFDQARREIAERMKAEAALRVSEERYSLAVKGTNDGIWDWNLVTNECYLSPRWKSMLGFGEDEIGLNPNEWLNRVHPEDREQLKAAILAHLQNREPHFEHEHRMRHKDGSFRWILTRGITLRDASGTPTRMAGSQSDITDRKLAVERLIHNAFYDTLTGLPNRALLLDRLNQAISRRKRWPDKYFSVLYLDLDHFKNVNDSMGHNTGDLLLVTVAERLKVNLRATDTVARLGGDEFILLIEETQGMENASEVAQRICKDLSTPRNINGHDVFITASIGIIPGDMDYEDPEQLLRDADIAMYSAKSSGRGRFEIFKMEMRDDFLEQLSTEYSLRYAIQENQLSLEYQPIVSLKTGKLSGFEALVRWEHPSNGLLNPKDFIPIAEDSGLILEVDRWVLKNATRQFSEWLKQVPTNHDIHLSVNLSAKSLGQLNLVAELGQILKEIGLEGKRLKLEITESAIIENSLHIHSMLEGMRTMGVDIHIDDFGTGYSSLSYLHQFPIQALKIDRSFISNYDPENGKHMPEIVRTVLHLAQDLELEAIAEGGNGNSIRTTARAQL